MTRSLGGDGNDTISGGDHDDWLIGEGGNDVFKFRVFNPGTVDIIADFTNGEDILEMRGNFESLEITFYLDGVLIEKNDHWIFLENVETLTEDDFNFV